MYVGVCVYVCVYIHVYIYIYMPMSNMFDWMWFDNLIGCGLSHPVKTLL